MIDAASNETLRGSNGICWAYTCDNPCHGRKHCASIPPHFPKLPSPWEANKMSSTYRHHSFGRRREPCDSVSYHLEQDVVPGPPSVVYSTASTIGGQAEHFSLGIPFSLLLRMTTSRRSPRVHPQHRRHLMTRQIILQVQHESDLPLVVHLLH